MANNNSSAGPSSAASGFPLTGIRVLDMSRVLAGPFAGRMLSDLGADVVKLEPPEGDITRLWGKKVGGVAGYFNQQNAGKRDVSVDLRNPVGVELVKALAAAADVLIENFRPDVMGRFGLGHDVLLAINPKLVMLSISGFGANNPESRRAAYAPIIHAESGLVHRQAEISGGAAADIGTSVADTNASLHGLVALLAALFERHTTGLGQHIDMAMIDATMVTLDGLHFDLDEQKRPLPNEVFDTAGGALMLAGDFRFIWHQLTKVCGVIDPTPEDATLVQKVAHRRAAATTFFTTTCTDRASVINALDRMNIAWGDVRTMAQATDLPSVRARQSIAEIDDRAGGSRSVPQTPYRFSRSQAAVRGGAPHLGEHNEEVLRDWLRCTDADLDHWRTALVAKDPTNDQKGKDSSDGGQV